MKLEAKKRAWKSKATRQSDPRVAEIFGRTFRALGKPENQSTRNLAQRQLAYSDTSLHAFGLAVVESISENPNGFSADLIHLLIIAIENGGSASAGRATQELNRISAFALSEPASEALGQRGSHPAE